MTTHLLSDEPECWPALPLESWKDTCDTLHMWTQDVGKVRLALTPLVNHWWNVPLYVTARGLTTSRIPYEARAIELMFDFLAHELVFETSEGTVKTLALKPQTVADFYRDCMAMLRGEGIDVKIWHMPVEVPNPIQGQPPLQLKSAYELDDEGSGVLTITTMEEGDYFSSN